MTPNQVVEEIEMELISQGGRVTLIDLAPILNIDFNHIEVAARTLVQKKKTIVELSGQLLTSWYIDGVVEEINESLQETGSVSIVALAQRFNLPADFMRQSIEHRLGTFVNGYIEEGQLYTQSFIQLHTARTRGIFRALVKPTPLRSVIQRYGLMESRVAKEVASMIKDGTLAGSLKGADDRAVYTPALFARGQENGANAFFQSNGFIEFKKLERLAIANPKSFVTTHYPTALQLSSLALSEGLVAGCVLSCEDAAASRLYVNGASILPNILSRDEVSQVLHHAIAQVEKTNPNANLHTVAEVWAVSKQFQEACQEYALQKLNREMDDEEVKIAEEAAAAAAAQSDAAPSATSASTALSKKKSAAVVSSDSESEEEVVSSKRSAKSSKSAANKKGKKNAHESDDEDEVVPSSKSKDKKKGRSKRGDSSDEDEPPVVVAKSKSKSSKSVSSSSASSSSAPLTHARVLKWLKSGWSRIVKDVQEGNAEIQPADSVTDESTEELMSALATLVQPKCTLQRKQRLASREAAATAAAAAASSAASTAAGVSAGTALGPGSEAILRRQQLETFRSAIQEVHESITLYSHGIDAITGRGDDKATPLPLPRADKTFITQLEAHLSKTLIASLVDLLLRCEAFASLTSAQQNQLPGCDNLVTLAATPSAQPETPSSSSAKDTPLKPRYELNRTPLNPKDRDAILAALPKRASEPLRQLVDVITKEPHIFLERFDMVSKPLDLRVKKLDKKSERSSIFNLRKTLMASLSVESRPAIVMHLTVILLFAKVHSVVLHAPAKVLQSMRRILKPDLQPVPYAKLRRYNQLVIRALRGDEPDEASSSSSSLVGVSDSEDEASDAETPKEQQVKHMPMADVETELQSGIEQIRAFGMDANTAVKGK